MEEATKKTTEEIQAEISRAMQARVRDFKGQADTLTLEGVRRALEGDMELEKFSLDVHKKFIKQCLNECFETADETESKTLGTAEEETPIQHENLPLEKTSSALDGLGNEVDIRKGSKYDNVVSEEKIREAVKKRAAYIREKIEKITSAEVRRLLEEDLKLEKNTLDSYKGFISKELDEVLLAPESVEATNGVEKPKKSSHGKASGKMSSISKSASEDSDSLDFSDGLSGDEKATEIRKPKRRRVHKIKAGTQGLKKQKKSPAQSKPTSRKKPVDSDLDPESEGGKSSDGSGEKVMEEAKPRNRPAPKSKASTQGLKKQKTSTATPSSMKKPKTSDLDKDSESEGGDPSEGNHSNSSAEESIKKVQKKVEKPTQAYGKQVEHLKSIIKSCGIGIGPSVYKRAKQAPESKREAFLIKELEEILDREGLSSNPSEKDIKVVKKKKERAKELEGIDMSNIVSSSRRRTTFNFIPPPKPKVEVDDDEDEDDEDNEDDEEDTDDDGDSGEGSDEDEESD